MTALFCDLVGFTPLSERLDPEEVRELQTEYFSSMAKQIERYGGVVEKYAGDAVLALFGAPIAHEDDAERAVLCALGMQEAIRSVAATARARWEAEPSIRIGVNTGEVVSGPWSASGPQGAAVTGDAVNTAARLQAAAEPGEILVGTETMRLTRRRIRYGPKHDLNLKGKSGTIPTYTALGTRTGVGERWEEGPRISPLVGRDRELVQLFDAWTRAQAGEGQLITLVGEPGVGKSRLLAEIVERVSRDSTVRIVRGRCLSYGQEISLWLVGDLLRSLFGIREQGATEDMQARLREAISARLSGLDEVAQAEACDVLGETLGLPAGESMVTHAGPRVRRQAMLRSLRLLLGSLSQDGPAVLVLEDLHWIDTASEEVLKEVLADVPGLRLLVLAAQRPGWTAPWSEWGWTERLTVRPLHQRDATTLAEAVLGVARISPELDRHLTDRAGGNPFFVEEMLHALEEIGGLERRDDTVSLAEDVAEKLPSSLTEVLLARLDRLEGEARDVAQVGSVIGRSFAVRLLAWVMEQAPNLLEAPLLALQRAEIAFPRQSADREYVFKHVSMREVAYHTLTQRRRHALHLATARAIASLYPVDEYVEMIAYHYARTIEQAEAATWLERAGDRAAAVYATEHAVTQYRETIRRLQEVGGDPVAVARVQEKLGTALFLAGWYEDALDALRQAAEMNRERQDLEATGRVTAQMGMVHRWLGTQEEGISLVQQMLDLLAVSSPSQALASLHTSLANLLFVVGRYTEAHDHAEKARAIAQAIGDERLLGEAMERRATALHMLNRPEEAMATFEQAIPLIEAGGSLLDLWRALNNAAATSENLGEIARCKAYTERALTIVERMDVPDQIAFVLANLGSTLITLGDWEEAGQVLQRVKALMGDERTANTPAPLGFLGQLALYRGKWDEAADFLDEALAAAQVMGERQVREDVLALLAELDILSGRPEAAIQRLRDLAEAEDVNPRVSPPLAWAYLEAGDVELASQVIARAIRRARASNQRFHLLEALRIQGMVLTRQGRPGEAGSVFQEALQLARSLPYPYAEARILERMGERHEALAIFRRLGAAKDAERIERQPASLNSAPVVTR